MSVRRSSLLFACVVATSLIAGCSSNADNLQSESGETRRFEGAYGTIDVPAEPLRVAAVGYDSAWQLRSLDVTPVAALDYTQQAASYTEEQLAFVEKAAPVGTFGSINFEAVLAAAPDVIVGEQFDVDEEAYRRLSEIAPTVVVGGGTERGDWQAITEQLATALGRTEVWEASRASYEQLRDATTAKYRDVIDRNRWICFSLADPGQFSIQLPTGATGNLLVNEMGLQYGPNVPLSDPDDKGWQAYPLEQLPSIFEGVTAAVTFSQANGEIFPAIRETIESPVFKTTTVSRTGHVAGMLTQVTDYVSAREWIEEFAKKFFEPLNA